MLLESAIFSNSRSKGLFAGVSLQGAAITIDDSANHDVYGKNVDAEDIVSGRVRVNNTVKSFVDKLQLYAPARQRIS